MVSINQEIVIILITLVILQKELYAVIKILERYKHRILVNNLTIMIKIMRLFIEYRTRFKILIYSWHTIFFYIEE